MSIFKRTQRKYVKKPYRVRDWRDYEAGLRDRGSLTVWISLTDGKLVNWDAPRPRRRKPGRQPKYGGGLTLEDVASVTAMLDRLLHRAHIIKCGPKSWRTQTENLQSGEVSR